MNKLTFTYTDHEGSETEITVPATWEICTDCRGNGGSSAYLGAFTREEWDEEGHEWQEDYLAGHYDRPCEHCRGSGKVLVIDREHADPADVKRYDEHMRHLAEMAAQDRALARAESPWDFM